VPIEVFGGYNPAIPPQDLPPGASPACQDVVFPMGTVRTRGGLQAQFAGGPIPGGANINGLKTFTTPQLVSELMAWDSLGNLYKENPQGTLNLLFTRPYHDLFYQSNTIFGREYQAFFNSTGGFDIPRQYDDLNWDRVSHGGPGAAPTAADSGTAGNIVAGKHQVSVCFINRQGWISMPAPNPTTWTAAGSKQVDLSNIAVGPSNIIARLLIFTPVITAPAVTGSFYSLPTGTQQLATPTAMLINDNTTTTLTVDFTDTILIAGFQANFLFTQRVLGECAFTAGYNSRVVWLGERNRQQNFVNMDFEGGFSGTPASTSTGPNSPSIAANGPHANVAWTSPGNVFVVDGIVSSASLLPSRGTDLLNVSGYGFAIPSNATITGIIVRALSGSTDGQISFNLVVLRKAGAITGTDHSNGVNLPPGLANQIYGNSLDMWGTTWTPADINNPGFGITFFALHNTISGPAATVNIDYVSIEVFYTTPGAGAVPLGWTAGASNAGGSSANAGGFPGDWQEAYAITGDGATAIRGQITQSAYQDYLNVPLIARDTAYRVRARVRISGAISQGTLHINLQSTSGAFVTPGLAVQVNQATADYAEFDGLLTTALVSPPTDLLLQVYVDGTPTNNGIFLVDSIEVYPTNIPYNYSTAWFSHAFNPESYDNTLSAIQVRPNDGQQLRAGFSIRNNYYLAKDHYLCYVTDDGVNEPASWPVNEVSSTIGICGPNAWDVTEEWGVFVERSGAYVIWGADPVKITPEIQEDASQTGKIVWNSINWQFGHTIWVRIDRTNKRVLIGAPVNGATSPNAVFVLDFVWLDNAQDIASSPIVTYSAFTGKILAHGRGRRWTYWNITANSMCFAERADGTSQPFFGNGSSNGKIYKQVDAPTQLSDDGAPINGYWQSHFAPSSVEEQIMHLGGHRKLFGYLKFRAIGLGNMLLTIFTSNRTTTLRGYMLSTVPAGDGGRPVNMHAERFSIRIGTNAVGQWFQLEKLSPQLKMAPTIVVRGVSQ
jgi:hypothetical protein